MYFILMQLCLGLFSWIAPETIVDLSTLTIVSYKSPPEANFYPKDLKTLLGHPEVTTIELRVATCSLSHGPSGDLMPALMGYQHVVAVGINSTGDLVTSAAKAALPCPPHCGGGKKRTTTIAEYLASH